MFSNTLRSSLIALVSSAIVANATVLLSLKISGPDSVNTASDFNVAATLTNTGDETAKVLNHPHSPLSSLPANIFAINHAQSGAEPTFNGVQVKYVPKVAAKNGGYTTLAPGQSVTVQHNLGDAYSFTPGQGIYSVKARHNEFHIVNPDSSISTIHATQLPAHTAKVLTASQIPHTASERRRARRQFDGSDTACTDGHHETIRAAADEGQRYIADSEWYMSRIRYTETTDPSERYTKWFGEYNSTRVDLVSRHFEALNSTDLSDLTYNCGQCNATDVYAYVYPDEYGTVYLCSLFFDSPLIGSDSQAGTLVHEASHFTQNGGTQDYAYGEVNATRLAQDYPDYAVMNADSHEYFAENTPALD